MLGTALVSVAIGLGLAVVYYAGSLWFGILISKQSATLAPALMVAGFVVRLAVLAAVVIPLALYTELNLVALLIAFLALFTLLSVWRIYVLAKKSDRGAKPPSDAAGSSAAPARKPDSSKGA